MNASTSFVRFGADQWVEAPPANLMSARIGLVTNDAARLAADPGILSRSALISAGLGVCRLFSPEHGISAAAPDGAAVADGVDPVTGLPVGSLYGERLRPARKALSELDAMVFDIPDVGARFYTYLWTLSHVLEACADARLPLYVLDRPNPLGGDLAAAEGPMLADADRTNFLGRAAIPVRHGLTLGEMALWLNDEWRLCADVEVIRCRNWRRGQHWPETGLPFVPTSPAMPAYESALLYPGTCLMEATNLSAGRGSPEPFRLIGAPWVDGAALATQFNALNLPGVAAEPARFTPGHPPLDAVECSGVRLRVTDRFSVRPVAVGLHLLALVIRLHRDRFEWAAYPTAANPSGAGHFERLIGRGGIREVLEQSPGDLATRIGEWTQTCGWAARVRSLLLYD